MSDAPRETIMEAVDNNDLASLKRLLEDFDRSVRGSQQELTEALTDVEDPACAMALLDHGASPVDFRGEGRWKLLDIPGWDSPFLGLAREDFEQNRRIVFGEENPQLVVNAYLRFAVRSRLPGWSLCSFFDLTDAWSALAPIWSAHRFGQSLTKLPDGRWVEIGGLHNDAHDTALFNDVIVTEKGEPKLFRYPESVFPPVYSHAAVLVEDSIHIIGGKPWDKPSSDYETLVYRLDLSTMAIERVEIEGPSPGLIHEHGAWLAAPGLIQLFGGSNCFGPTELYSTSAWRESFEWQLDLNSRRWVHQSPGEGDSG